jgi:hypothetical protein
LLGGRRGVVLKEGVQDVLGTVNVWGEVSIWYDVVGEEMGVLPIMASRYFPESVTLVRPMTGLDWVTEYY